MRLKCFSRRSTQTYEFSMRTSFAVATTAPPPNSSTRILSPTVAQFIDQIAVGRNCFKNACASCPAVHALPDSSA